MTATAAPSDIILGPVGLVVTDLTRAAAFYGDLLGLTPLGRPRGRMAFGTATGTLIELTELPGARRDPAMADLFHVALRVPTRADLARVLLRLKAQGTMLQGMSDHRVSEALYLADPEGNGIELYCDRPRQRWFEGESLAMTTARLDIADLLREAADLGEAGLPDRTDIGHVHLEAIEPGASEHFYTATLGLEVMARYPNAVFMSRNGYHHHIACNGWNQRSLPRASGGEVAGLDYVAITLRRAGYLDEIMARSGARPGKDHVVELVDPAGLTLRLSAAV